MSATSNDMLRERLDRVATNAETHSTAMALAALNVPNLRIVPSQSRATNEKLDKSFGENVCVIGSGSYGTSIASRLASSGANVCLWGRDQAVIDDINGNHQNSRYLGSAPLSPNLQATANLDRALMNRGVILVAVPSDALPAVLSQINPHPKSVVISLTKGFVFTNWDRTDIGEAIQNGPHPTCRVLTPLQYMAGLSGWGELEHVGVAAGPGFAKNVANGALFGITLASRSEHARKTGYYLLSNDALRVKVINDPLGTEIAAAMKNVTAFAVGMLMGLKGKDAVPLYGEEQKAMLMGEAVLEALHLAKYIMRGESDRYKIKHRTFLTPAGFPDYQLSCTPQGRNFTAGREIAEGLDPATVLKRRTSEGAWAAMGAKLLAEPQQPGKHGMYAPMINAVVDIMQGKAAPQRIFDAVFRSFGGIPEAEKDKAAEHLRPFKVKPFRRSIG